MNSYGPLSPWCSSPIQVNYGNGFGMSPVIFSKQRWSTSSIKVRVNCGVYVGPGLSGNCSSFFWHGDISRRVVLSWSLMCWCHNPPPWRNRNGGPTRWPTGSWTLLKKQRLIFLPALTWKYVFWCRNPATKNGGGQVHNPTWRHFPQSNLPPQSDFTATKHQSCTYRPVPAP